MPLENIGNKIVSIKELKNKVVIRFKDASKLEVSKEVFTSFYLYKGKILTNADIREIENQNRVEELYKYARKISTTRIYSEHKMRDKLYLKTSNTTEVNIVITKLKKVGLINDKEFVKEYVEYANSKNIGKNKIIAKLLEKGVFKEEIDKIEFTRKGELKKAMTYLDKLETKYKNLNDTAKKDHATRYLVSQGFDTIIAREVAEELKPTDTKIVNKKLKEDFLKVSRQYSKKYSGRELKEKIYQSLLRKGYKMSDISAAMEDKHL